MSLTPKVTWPASFRRAFQEAIISHYILTGFIATEIYPWNPLAIPVSAFLLYEAFNEGSMQISEAEATISLEASDNNVLSILRSSIENVPYTSYVTPREKENSVTSNIASTEEDSSGHSPSLN